MTLTDTSVPSFWQNTGPSAPDPLDAAFTAEWLSRQVLPPVEYVVPGIIPEGLTLLVAPPKLGKSWMVLGIAAAAAEGGQVFGSISVDKRPVLYLALEDGPRRLQSRMEAINADTSPNLMFMPKLDVPAAIVISTFLDRFGDRKPLVILDTLGKVRGTYGGNDAYGNDYSQMSALKDLVDAAPGSSLIVVHHTNKGEKSDFLDSVSGTQGLAGAADSILAVKRERNTGSATLHVTSRDASEGEYAVTLTEGVWTLDGDGLKESAQRAATRKVTSGLGDEMTAVVEAVNAHPEGMRAGDITTLLGIDPEIARKYLRRAADAERVLTPSRGLYTPVPSVPSVPLPGQGVAERDTPLLDSVPNVKSRPDSNETHGTQETPLQGGGQRETPTLRSQVLEAVEQAGGEVSASDVLLAVPELQTNKIASTHLGQLTSSGLIRKAGWGKYATLEHQETN